MLVTRDGSFWHLPGRQVEPGERPRDALVREMAKEACGCVPDVERSNLRA